MISPTVHKAFVIGVRMQTTLGRVCLAGHATHVRRDLAIKIFSALFARNSTLTDMLRWPRPCYCDMCGMWAWCSNEIPAYSAERCAFLCEDCANINDADTEAAYREFYAGRL